MDDKFTSLPKLFVDKMIKKDELPYQGCVSLIEIRKMEQRKSTDGKICTVREKGKNILSYVDFYKLWHVITYFTELNKYVGKEDITLTIYSS